MFTNFKRRNKGCNIVLNNHIIKYFYPCIQRVGCWKILSSTKNGIPEPHPPKKNKKQILHHVVKFWELGHAVNFLAPPYLFHLYFFQLLSCYSMIVSNSYWQRNLYITTTNIITCISLPNISDHGSPQSFIALSNTCFFTVVLSLCLPIHLFTH